MRIGRRRLSQREVIRAAEAQWYQMVDLIIRMRASRQGTGRGLGLTIRQRTRVLQQWPKEAQPK
jgi:hypothetical protein